ncbi:carboxylesterase/lipase family protein [Marilutibacter alkalisoli]|uniref:Carboxylic ester hydrolase n=1 Tax=Marilutibacter alkalisoli TaxID=2591633 RepID=A0A514BNC9_9GAMM|nr:carboxylesterase/lipase family protein [Lysobacter alkalisoli]QDH68898.1 carboxylesterase/lipase family protein [Lysobacter alkalisoli]
MTDAHRGADPQRRALLKAGLTVGAATALPFAAHAASGAIHPVATTRSGPVRGFNDRGMHVFRGIPYGADTAPRRFRPALREAEWQGVRDALEFGPATPQHNSSEPTGEDCLFLNVTTPALRDGGKRPVLVYIHGGGFNNGSGSDPLYDGVNLCRRGDVVVVTVNHRLNAFGYLHLGSLGGPEYAGSGNVGQLDLVQALQWMREHAIEFGGDPGNVTVFGQSGGGAKIATLMAMPAARGLFHRAWTMSGQQVTAAGPRAATQRAERFIEAAGLQPGDIDGLLRLSPERLLEAAKVRDFSRVEDSSLYFGPVMDSDSLPVHPFWPEAPAQSAHIPMVIGNTRDETRAFLGNDPRNFELDWDELPARLEKQQFVDIDPHTVIAEYRRLYPDYTPSEVFFAATTAGRSWRGAVEEAEVRARQAVPSHAPTWAYQLDWHPHTEEGRKFRAFHTLDIPLVFDTLDQPGARTGSSADARRAASEMSEALVAFARTGDPNHAGIPTWAPYSIDRRETMVFDHTSRLEHDPRGGERRLYEQVPFVQRGTM